MCLLLNLSLLFNLLAEMARMVGCIIVKRNIEIYTKVAITGEHEIVLSTQYLNKKLNNNKIIIISYIISYL